MDPQASEEYVNVSLALKGLTVEQLAEIANRQNGPTEPPEKSAGGLKPTDNRKT